MSEAAIRTLIYTVVNGVTGIGKFYDYDRWADNWSAFLDYFKTTVGGVTQIRGGDIFYEGFTVERIQFRDATDKGGELRAHRFAINLYMGLDDSTSSEKTFSALAEDVCDALDDDETIRNRASNYYYAPEASLEIDRLTYGGVLCHHALIVQEVQEYIAS